MANSAAQDEFVDLYQVLELDENTDTEQIRKRVNALYLEAQQNLDHRNVKKRLQFQQMYEIYLPQARHLLLDSHRRSEYDRYLQAWRTGGKVEATEPPATPAPTSSDLSGTPAKVSDHDLPEIVEQEVDPEKLAAEREAMWSKWKTGLELTTEQAESESLPQAAISVTPPAQPKPRAVPRQSAPPPPQKPSSTPARPAPPRPVVPRFDPKRPTSTTSTTATAATSTSTASPKPRSESTTPAKAPDASFARMETQGEQQRFQLIKTAVQNAGMVWGFGTGGAIFAVGCIILLILDSALKPTPLGLSRVAFALVGFFIVLILASLGGVIARKKAKIRLVTELSSLTLEELSHRVRK